MKRRRTETSFSPFFLLFFDHKNAESSCAAVADQQHIQLPPPPDLLFGKQQPLAAGSRPVPADSASPDSGRRRASGPRWKAAEKPVGIVPHLQRIENIQKVLLQPIELIEKGKPDQHIAVNNVARIIGFIAASVAGNRAERKARHIGAGPLRVLVNVDHTVLQTVIAGRHKNRNTAA